MKSGSMSKVSRSTEEFRKHLAEALERVEWMLDLPDEEQSKYFKKLNEKADLYHYYLSICK